MHQTQWSPERPLPPPVSLTSQSDHEKPPEVTCTSRGKPGFPASTREEEGPSNKRRPQPCLLCAPPPCGTHFAMQQLASGWLLGAQLSGDLPQDRGRQLSAVARQEVSQQGVHLACRDERVVRWLN